MTPRRWTIHVCEDHGWIDCDRCSIHDVVTVVAEAVPRDVADVRAAVRSCRQSLAFAAPEARERHWNVLLERLEGIVGGPSS